MHVAHPPSPYSRNHKGRSLRDTYYIKDKNKAFEKRHLSLADLSFLFNEQELYDLWQRNYFEWYDEKGPSPLSDECMYQLGRNLLENFILTDDTVIASRRPCVT